MIISNDMTLTQCIEIGFVTQGQVDSFNKKLERHNKRELDKKRILEISEYITEHSQEAKLYRTGDFMKRCMEDFKQFIDDTPGFEDKRVVIHKLITRSLKKLVNDGVMVVTNSTGNHAHNRYGLTPDLDELPAFASIAEIEEESINEE